VTLDYPKPPIFTLRRYVMLSSCVCPSVTSRRSSMSAEHRIMYTTPYDSAGILVF